MSRRTERQHSDGVVSMDADGKFVVNAARGDDEPRSITFARAFLLVVNVLSFLGGLALLGIGIYVFIEFNARFSGLLSENAAIGAIVAGVIMSLISCVGIFGIMHNQWKIILVYLVVSLAILITILSVLGLFVEYINTVSQVASGTLTVFNARQVEVNDFFASAYTKCCVQNNLFCSSLVPGTEGYCKPVPYCSNRNGTEVCYAGEYGPNPNNPPKLVFQEFCGTLIAFEMAGPANSETGMCGFPDGAAGFMQDVFGWVGTNVTYPYICIGLLSALIFLEILASGYLARHIVMVKNGDFDLMRSKRKNAKSKSESNADSRAGGGVVTLADQFRFNDDFELNVQKGISANDLDNRSQHSSTRLQAGNPVFRNMFASNAKKVEDEESRDGSMDI